MLARETPAVEPTPEYLDLIAARITDGLNAVLPPDVRLRESIGELWFFEDNVLMNLGSLESLGATIASVAERVLEEVQDDVTTVLTVPWPEVQGKPLGYFAAPRADVLGDTLRLWFEVDGDAVGPEVIVSLRPARSG